MSHQIIIKFVLVFIISLVGIIFILGMLTNQFVISFILSLVIAVLSIKGD